VCGSLREVPMDPDRSRLPQNRRRNRDSLISPEFQDDGIVRLKQV
jgi:hypothetical protein